MLARSLREATHPSGLPRRPGACNTNECRSRVNDGQHEQGRVTLGLSASWRRFWLLVLVNAFVGSMLGLERPVLPLLAEAEFGLASKGAIL